MKFTLSQSSYELRDAGEVAFGILVMAILAAAGAILLTAVLLGALGAPAASSCRQAWRFGSLGSCLCFVTNRGATRSWTAERQRRRYVVFWSSACAAAVSFLASMILGTEAGGVVHALRVCLAGFVLLLCAQPRGEPTFYSVTDRG